MGAEGHGELKNPKLGEFKWSVRLSHQTETLWWWDVHIAWVNNSPCSRLTLNTDPPSDAIPRVDSWKRGKLTMLSEDVIGTATVRSSKCISLQTARQIWPKPFFFPFLPFLTSLSHLRHISSLESYLHTEHYAEAIYWVAKKAKQQFKRQAVFRMKNCGTRPPTVKMPAGSFPSQAHLSPQCRNTSPEPQRREPSPWQPVLHNKVQVR